MPLVWPSMFRIVVNTPVRNGVNLDRVLSQQAGREYDVNPLQCSFGTAYFELTSTLTDQCPTDHVAAILRRSNRSDL